VSRSDVVRALAVPDEQTEIHLRHVLDELSLDGDRIECSVGGGRVTLAGRSRRGGSRSSWRPGGASTRRRAGGRADRVEARRLRRCPRSAAVPDRARALRLLTRQRLRRLLASRHGEHRKIRESPHAGGRVAVQYGDQRRARTASGTEITGKS
jgi:hypothetical protein